MNKEDIGLIVAVFVGVHKPTLTYGLSLSRQMPGKFGNRLYGQIWNDRTIVCVGFPIFTCFNQNTG
jgi:hypothetical protein